MSLRKPVASIVAHLDSLRTLINGPLPWHTLTREQTLALTYRLLGAGFSPVTVRHLTGISRRTLTRILRTPIPRHPLRHPHRAAPTRPWHPRHEDYVAWAWFSSPLDRLDLMVQLSEELRIAIDDVLSFCLTAFSGPSAYALQTCRLCERLTPRRRGTSTVCVICRKLGYHARDKAHRASLAHLG